MRVFHTFEIDNIENLAQIKPYSNDDFTADEIVAINENLRKNISFYLNNFVIFMPEKEPKSAYINLRLDNRPVLEVLKGKVLINST